ncbi:hypothetical protein [Microbacterium sp. SORGH_AS_0862]|uniref:hypothetical protein n=1 Tax=Microbacterium sp. SORGH_AS_0862 TaxID=3041789 RepID=UPI002791A5C6|nr:hypothetical protein [Microbacterium sp. SORGH_AS_0862]MDQ1205049.1 TolA-binding protein [Microbacterium sp. SORGH_AS_0862]
MGRKNKEQIASLEQQLAEAQSKIGALDYERSILLAAKQDRERRERREAEKAQREARAEEHRKNLADLAIGLVSVEDADVSFHNDKDADHKSVTIELDLDEEQAKALRRFVDSRDVAPAATITGTSMLQNMIDAQTVRSVMSADRIFGHRYNGGVVVV